MSTFFLGLFHSCSLSNGCFSKDCKRINHRKNENMKEINLMKLVGCIPLVGGQIMGIVLIREGLKVYRKQEEFAKKVEGVSTVVRGVLTFLGLGIVCLLVDVLVTLALLIKNCLEKCC